MRKRKINLREDQGNILVLTALCMTSLCGVLALAVDAGHALYAKRQLQTLADAAALAGSIEVSTCGSTANCAAMQGAAKGALVENGATSSSITVVTQCAATTATGLVLTVNNGPCAMGASDPNQGNKSYVEAVVTMPVNMLFGGVIGKSKLTVGARAEAAVTKPSNCLYVLNPTAGNAVIINGYATLKASCGVAVNSSSSSAVIFNGGDVVTTTGFSIHGGDINNGSNTLTPMPTLGAGTVTDPLSSMKPPTWTCPSNGPGTTPFTGSKTQVVVSSGSAVFNPGVYCGGITINGTGINVTFNPGNYIINGALLINGSDTLKGNGVMLYFPSGSMTLNGSSSVSLSAPTTGTYAGILLYQPTSNTGAIIVNGDTSSKWEGTIYAPGAQLTLNGGSNVAAYTSLVVDTLIQNGYVNFALGSNYSSLPNGSPIKGGTSYLVE